MFFSSGQEFKSVCGARIAGLIAWASVKRNLKLGATVVGEWPDTRNAMTTKTIPNQKKTSSSPSAKPETNNTHYYYGSVRTGPSRKITLKLINELAATNNALTSGCLPDTHATDGLQKLIELTAVHAQNQSTVYIISDYKGFDSACAKTIASLGRKCTLVMIMISDSLEESLNIRGTVGISNGYNHRALHMSAASRNQYQKMRQDFHESIQRSAEQSNATLLRHVLSSR